MDLSSAQFEALEDKVYVFGFDEAVLALKRSAGDEVRYLDLREHGNLARLFNDEQVRVCMHARTCTHTVHVHAHVHAPAHHARACPP